MINADADDIEPVNVVRRPGSTEVIIEGVPVEFPFDPYDVQRDYMASVIRALNNTQNALLESPTGTGKTLSLLCASMAWLRQHKQSTFGANASAVKVLYASRTHAQLAQVVREFKRTAYSEDCVISVLGSRDHLCVNNEVKRLPNTHARNSACNQLRVARGCRFGNHVTEAVSKQLTSANTLGAMDIEDLVKEGRRQGFCPYYFEREMAKDADLVLLPYTYVVDSSLRKQLSDLVDLQRCVLLFDEAHNIPSNMADSASTNLTALDISNAMHDASMCCNRCQQQLQEGDLDLAMQGELQESLNEYATLKLVLHQIERSLEGVDLPEHRKELVKPSSEMLSFLALAGLTHETAIATTNVLTKGVNYLSGTDSGGRGLVAFQGFLDAVFFRHTDLSDEVKDSAFRFVVTASERSGMRRNEFQGSRVVKKTATHEMRSLGYWCLDTSVAMQPVMTTFPMVIMTSGTLSPMDHFAAELGVDFPIQLRGRHVIDQSQLFAAVVSKGPSGLALNGSFEFRNTEEYKTQLGQTVINIARNVPGGMLVFFASYSAMNSAVDLWRRGTQGSSGATVWGMLSEVKSVFVEPTDTSELPALVQGFQEAADQPKGAVLLAVARGKISEGVDFADTHGRCVLVAGIPYANSTELIVRLKREYLTKIAPTRPRVNGKLFGGDDWYRNEAMRAVNQCIGRVIRHKDDFGCIILGDERFAHQRDTLSGWVRASLKSCPEFRDAYREVTQFFIKRRGMGKDSLATKRARRGDDANDGSTNAGLGDSIAVREAPTSAEAARRFAIAEAERRENEKEIRESPTKPLAGDNPPGVSPAVAAPALFDSSGARRAVVFETNPSLGMMAVKPAAPKQPAVQLQQQQQPPPAPIQNTLSSTEFRERLKARLPDANYNDFKEVLIGIMKLAKNPAAQPDNNREQFTQLFERLRQSFESCLPAKDAKTLLTEFGCFVPVGFRPLYALLLR